jgi:hypothetical protein
MFSSAAKTSAVILALMASTIPFARAQGAETPAVNIEFVAQQGGSHRPHDSGKARGPSSATEKLMGTSLRRYEDKEPARVPTFGPRDDSWLHWGSNDNNG